MEEEKNKESEVIQEHKMSENDKTDEMQKKVKSKTEKIINQIIDDGLELSNVDLLGKLIDIHKDISNEKYWKIKEEVYQMRYDDYNDYGRRGIPGSGRGSYGRRGVPGSGRGRYRGEDPVDEMREHYENYNEASEEMDRGNYGAEGEMVKSAESIMKNICEIVEELSETGSPDVMRVIKKYSKKMSEM